MSLFLVLVSIPMVAFKYWEKLPAANLTNIYQHLIGLQMYGFQANRSN